ncbi:MAG: 50S ribosome-binding GTPase [Acidimicrobiia bacterium]|jgi:GTP-binding protein EngB required for normal cell division
MRDVTELLDTVDLAVARAAPITTEERWEHAAARARELRTRQGFLGETLVLAVAGGTGVGKSSLVNALAGEALVSVSTLRPHTEEAIAILPEEPEPDLLTLLDALGITERHAHPGFPHLAIIDLPDMDSVVSWHRHRVEELIPRVDGVMWVLDAEKYADRALHQDFLAPLATHRDQFVFVLNKIDRLRSGQIGDVEAHLCAMLDDDGYPDVEPFAVAADPAEGRRLGIDGLRDHLTTRLDAKRIMLGKLVADALVLVRDLGTSAGVWDGTEIHLEERWAETRRAAAAHLMPGGGAAARDDAACRVEDLVAAIAAEIGGVHGERVRHAFGSEVIADALTEAAAAAAEATPDRGRRRRAVSEARRRAAEDALDGRVGLPLAQMLGERARFGATVAHAGLAAYQLAERLRRPT